MVTPKNKEMKTDIIMMNTQIKKYMIIIGKENFHEK
jgi:hypothetical protein